MTWSDTELATNNDYMSQEMAEHQRLKMATIAEDEDETEVPEKAEQPKKPEKKVEEDEEEEEEKEEAQEEEAEEEEAEEEDEEKDEQNDMVVDLSVIQDGLKQAQEARTQEAQGSDSDTEEEAKITKKPEDVVEQAKVAKKSKPAQEDAHEDAQEGAEQKQAKKKRKQSDGVEEKISSPNGGASKKARKPEKRRVCNMCNRELGMQTWRRHQSCYQKSQSRSDGEPRKRHQCSKCQAVVAGCTALHSSHKCGEEQWDQETKTYMKISKLPRKTVQAAELDDDTESDESSDDKPNAKAPLPKAPLPKALVPPKALALPALALVPKVRMADAEAAPQIRMIDVNGTKRDKMLADFIRALNGREGYVLVIPPM